MTDDRRSLTILFADLGGSTRLYDTLGDVEARRITASCIGQIVDAACGLGGRVVKTIGDEVMCAFDRVDTAVDAAIAIVGAIGTGATAGMGVHVGLHTGPVVEEKDDVFGDTVNLASRLVGLARDGEILTTRAVVDALSADRRLLTRPIERRSLKGKEEKVEIHAVVAPTDASFTALHLTDFDEDEEQESDARLVLRLGAASLTLDAARPRATIGRLASADLVLTDDGVSRQHAMVELRNGKFYLCDASTNGTVLLVDGQQPMFLRREEAILQGSGRFGLSRHPEPEPVTPIHFVVEHAG